MARDPLAAVSLTATPQTQPIPGRTDQVRNNAGGYVFAKDLFTKVEDFLILGATGGTFYITEDRLTMDNAGWLIQAVQADGARMVRLITEVSTARPPQACKARQRATPAGEAFALRDALRIAHPKADTAERRALLGWLAGKVDDGEVRSQVPAVDVFLSAQAVTTEAAAIAIATERTVPWEFLPSGMLASATVWEALVPHLGMTALLRNLARLTRLGVLGPFAPTNEVVAARLRNAEALRGGRIHPMDVFLALRV
jgi:TROVE domain